MSERVAMPALGESVTEGTVTRWLKEVGEEHFQVSKPTMGGEDFSYMLEARPGAYIFVGNGDTAMVHHPAYDFDDDAIPFGSSWFAGMVEARMPAA